MCKTISVTVVCLFFLSVAAYNDNKVRVAVYYETLCPGCKQFMSEQLYPAYKLIDNLMYLDFIPYGHETRTRLSNGTYSFSCQHGSQECYGNKVHGCIVKYYSIEESTEFIVCSMMSEDPASESVLKQCAVNANVPWTFIEKCLTLGQATAIQLEMALKTEKLNPKYVPAITFNGYYNSTLQDEATTDLIGVICKLLQNKPKECDEVLRKRFNNDILVYQL